MKKLFTFIAAFLISINLFAQAPPQKMTYQFVARNNQNQLIQNNTLGMRVSILKNSPEGVAVYIETHQPQTNGNGTASIEVGAGTVVSGIFSAIDWSAGTYFIKTEVDPKGQQDYTISGTNQLLSVPYALYAGRAAVADSVSISFIEKDPHFKNSVAGGITSTDTSRWNKNTGSKHYIGEYFGGGVIFHLWEDENGLQHGLIVSLNDQSKTAIWSNISGVSIGLSAESPWDGLANSLAIVAQSGHTSSAAKLCLDLESGGQTDWYLPAIDELVLLWQNRFNVNKTLSRISGADQIPHREQIVAYLSSTEHTEWSAFALQFFSIQVSSPIKNQEGRAYVRAIRKF